ncbi:MAG: CopG family transcriptional regulator [Acidobacteriota bacterium]
MSLPKALLRKAKVLAAERRIPLTRLLTGVLEQLVKDRDDYERAKRRALAHMRHATNLGTNGRITWTRDSLHERRK